MFASSHNPDTWPCKQFSCPWPDRPLLLQCIDLFFYFFKRNQVLWPQTQFAVVTEKIRAVNMIWNTFVSLSKKPCHKVTAEIKKKSDNFVTFLIMCLHCVGDFHCFILLQKERNDNSSLLKTFHYKGRKSCLVFYSFLLKVKIKVSQLFSALIAEKQIEQPGKLHYLSLKQNPTKWFTTSSERE